MASQQLVNISLLMGELPDMMDVDDTEVMREMRVRAEGLVDQLIKLKAQHSEKIAIMEARLTRLESMERRPWVRVPFLLGVGSLSALAITMIRLLMAMVSHVWVQSDVHKLVAWASYHGPEVPELSRISMWNAGESGILADAKGGNDYSVLSALFRVAFQMVLEVVGGVAGGALHGLAQAMIALTSVPILLLFLFLGVRLMSGNGVSLSGFSLQDMTPSLVHNLLGSSDLMRRIGRQIFQ